MQEVSTATSQNQPENQLLKIPVLIGYCSWFLWVEFGLGTGVCLVSTLCCLQPRLDGARAAGCLLGPSHVTSSCARPSSLRAGRPPRACVPERQQGRCWIALYALPPGAMQHLFTAFFAYQSLPRFMGVLEASPSPVLKRCIHIMLSEEHTGQGTD